MNQRDLTTSTIPESRCPRCGYDLQGIMATWKTACDLEGTCAECGLEFEWADVLDKRRFLPSWCVEYSTSIGEFIRRTPKTFLKTLTPRAYWRQLRLSHEIKWAKLLLYPTMLMIQFYVLAGLIGFFSMFLQMLVVGVDRFDAFEHLHALIKPFAFTSPFGRDLHWAIRNERFTLCLLMLLAFMALLPISYVVIPVSRRRAKVKWAHLGRIAGHGLAIVFLPLAIFGGLLAFKFIDQMYIGWGVSRLVTQKDLMMIIMLSMFPLTTLWWAIASKHYLKLPHAAGVATLLSIATLLFLILVFAGLLLLGLVPHWFFA